MPYAIRKRGGKYVVTKASNGKVLGTHPSRAAAERQVRAIYANEHSK